MKQDGYNDKFVTGVIVLLATILTTVSLAMIAVAASERSSNLTETILIALLSGSIALSAHLLPALTRKRVGKKSGFLVAIIWMFSVLVTLYSHTVFFISTTSNAGDVRAEKSVEVKDIEKIAQQNQQIALATKSRSIVDITNDKLEVEKSIIDLNRRNCEKCKTTQSRLQQRQAELQALNTELEESKKAEVSRNKVLSLNEQALKVKNGEKLDPVTEKLSLIFKGFNVDAMTLFISVVSAALLEALASLFWWLVWPNRNVHSKINMNNFIHQNEEENKDKEIPLDRKIKHSMRKEISLLEDRMKANIENGENNILNFIELKLSHIENHYFKNSNEKLSISETNNEEKNSIETSLDESESEKEINNAQKEASEPEIKKDSKKIEEEIIVKQTVEEKSNHTEKAVEPVIEEEPNSIEKVVKPVVEEESNSIEEVVEPTIEEESNSIEEVVEPTIEEESNNIEEFVEPTIEEESNSIEEVVEPTIEEESNSIEEVVEPTIEEESNSIEEVVEPTIEEKSNEIEEVVEPTIEEKSNEIEEVVQPEIKTEELNTENEKKEENNNSISKIETIFADFDEDFVKQPKIEDAKPKVIVPIKDPEINPLIENPLLELDISSFLDKTLTHDKLANLRINK